MLINELFMNIRYEKVRYIHLSDFQGSYGSLRIEIEVYAGNSKVSYNYCNGCSRF